MKWEEAVFLQMIACRMHGINNWVTGYTLT